VFVDVERETLNMDPQALAATMLDLERGLRSRGATMPTVVKAINAAKPSSGSARSAGRRSRPTPRVKAVVPVHMAGHPCEIADIARIAEQYGLAVVEDAAHACSASFRSRRIGSAATRSVLATTCFSFYATKTLATGEGGMITTDDDAVAERVRVMSLHGISKDAWKRYTAAGSWYYEIMAPGFKYNMSDVMAAIGLAQLRKVDAMRQRRAEIAQLYNDAFASYAELEVPTVRADVGHAWHLYTLRVSGLSIGRDEFIECLRQANIGTSVHFIPLHVHPYYEATYGYHAEDLPVAFHEYRREISLPIYSKMTDFDVRSVIDAVANVVEQFRTTRRYAVAGH
jgi:dTDP-4-amino-4,6-dideoxygalactose transaminase